MPRGEPATAAIEFRRHWLVLLCCGLGLAVGPIGLPYYTAGVFFGPLEQEFGWSRGELSLGVSLLVFGLAVTAPFVGVIADRRGERWLIGISMLLMSGCLAAMSQLRPPVMLYHLAFLGVALLGAGCSTLTFSRVVARHFVKGRGFALGLALTGTGVASMAGPVLLSRVVQDLGWRTGYLTLSLVALIATPLIVAPLWLGSARSGGAAKQAAAHNPAGSWEPLKDLLFWQISLAFAAALVGIAGAAVHLIPLLMDAGVSPAAAGMRAGAIGLAMILGRLLAGYLIDRIFAGWVGAACMLAGAIGLGLLALDPTNFALVGALAVGLVIGVEFDLLAFLVAKYFGVHRFGRLYGVAYGLAAAGSAASPVLYGVWFDWVGDYRPVLLFGGALLALAALGVGGLPRTSNADAEPDARAALKVTH